ncbi:MAG: hypothetical protein PHO27_04260 [Sulfuricurvum sp.]|nr:hypothetical protein [Sulfuricurvum sp.]
MKLSSIFSVSLSALLLHGCAASHTGVTPSQNSSLGAVSPSTTASGKGGMIQHSLDNWLRDEWTPATSSSATAPTTAQNSVKEAQNPSTTSTEAKIEEPEDKGPFTLQKYVDKWKAYHENQTKKMNGEVPTIEKVNALPVIGK